jgi:hypothetical protein
LVKRTERLVAEAHGKENKNLAGGMAGRRSKSAVFSSQGAKRQSLTAGLIMSADLPKDSIGRILGFLGYGRPSAPIWFIGLEEALGRMDDGEVGRNLVARGQFEPIMEEVAESVVERGTVFVPLITELLRLAQAH